jgi:hypothetical protein
MHAYSRPRLKALTGSDRCTVKPTRLTRFGRRPAPLSGAACEKRRTEFGCAAAFWLSQALGLRC